MIATGGSFNNDHYREEMDYMEMGGREGMGESGNATITGLPTVRPN